LFAHGNEKTAAATATAATTAAAKGHAMASLTAKDLATAFVCHQSVPVHLWHA
jgi:hypothetical protein